MERKRRGGVCGGENGTTSVFGEVKSGREDERGRGGGEERKVVVSQWGLSLLVRWDRVGREADKRRRLDLI